MDFHSDKGLFKIVFIVLFALSVPILFLAYASAGLKAVIFTAWLLFAVIAFFAVIVLTFNKGTETTSEGFVGSYTDIWFNFYGYRIFIFLLFAFLFGISALFWDWLGQFFPPSEIVKSQMPAGR